MPSVVRSARPGLVLALVCGAQFMIILDLAIVNVALISIQADLGASQADLQWVVVGYGLTLGGFLLLGGRLADVLGRRPVLITGLAIFSAASLGAGMAGSLGVLVACRVVQGVGGALVSPAALSILTTTFAEGPARNRALGIFGAVGGTAATVGTIAGGALTTGPGWEWVFLMNVPVGVALIAGLVLVVPTGVRPPRMPFDVAGALTVTGGLVVVVYAINRSVEHGWLTASTLGLLAAGGALLTAFVLIESRSSAPLVPLSMFRRRNLTAATLVAALVFGSFLAAIYQGTLFLQQVLGYSAIDTGVAWLAATLSSLVVAGGLAARLVGRFGPRSVLVVGQLVMAAGLLVRVPRPGRRRLLGRSVPRLRRARRGHRAVGGRRPGRRLHGRRAGRQRPGRRDGGDGARGRWRRRCRRRRHDRHRPHPARRHDRRPGRRRAHRRLRAGDRRGRGDPPSPRPSPRRSSCAVARRPTPSDEPAACRRPSRPSRTPEAEQSSTRTIRTVTMTTVDLVAWRQGAP